jgi:hypothetical protein
VRCGTGRLSLFVFFFDYCLLLFYMWNWQDVNVIPLFDNRRASIAVVVPLDYGSIVSSNYPCHRGTEDGSRHRGKNQLAHSHSPGAASHWSMS